VRPIVIETRWGWARDETNGTVALIWPAMRTTPIALGTSLFVALVALVGCAAEGIDDDPEESYLASTPAEAGAEEGESVKVPAPQPKDDDDLPAADDGDDDAGVGGGGDAGTGSDAGTGGGGTGTGGTGTATCAAANTCMGATNLGMVSGDTGADKKSATGTGSKWFTVRVTEDDSSAFGAKLWMKTTLTSPPGSNYDLYVYVPGSDTRACTTVTKSSTTTASTDTASVSFGEGGTLSNGSDDSRTVTVEVRHVSGPCGASAEWTLDVFGNQL
jgi:hypothetical protein